MKPALLLLIACLSAYALYAQPDVQKRYQTKLIMADDGSTIDLDAGIFTFTGSLSRILNT